MLRLLLIPIILILIPLTSHAVSLNDIHNNPNQYTLVYSDEKIEEFKVGKKYETSLNLLCGYLLFDVLRISNNIEDETELIELIKSKKDYFASDTFMNRAMIAMSPILFANNLNRKDRQ